MEAARPIGYGVQFFEQHAANAAAAQCWEMQACLQWHIQFGVCKYALSMYEIACGYIG